MSVAQLVVTGGAASVIVALVGGFFGWRMNQANYAKALVETSNAFTERLDKRNESLEAKVDRLELHIDGLDDRVTALSEQLRIAIPLLQASGHDVAEMRAVLRRSV